MSLNPIIAYDHLQPEFRARVRVNDGVIAHAYQNAPRPCLAELDELQTIGLAAGSATHFSEQVKANANRVGKKP